MSTIDTANLDTTLEVLRKHRVLVFKSDAFSVEIDAASYDLPAAAPEEMEPGTGEGAAVTEQRRQQALMYRSAG